MCFIDLLIIYIRVSINIRYELDLNVPGKMASEHTVPTGNFGGKPPPPLPSGILGEIYSEILETLYYLNCCLGAMLKYCNLRREKHPHFAGVLEVKPFLPKEKRKWHALV